MTPEERRAALWAQRQAAFGDDAVEIWAAELRNARVGDALAAIGQAPQLPVREKLGRVLAAVQEAYGDDAPALLEARGTEIMKRFLGVPVVQDDLHAMAPMERTAALREIRAGMGLDAAALTRWDELDRARDIAWDAGQQYPQERAALLATPAGAERDRRRRELQDRLLGEDAETLRSEEAAGFNRFAHRRRYGRE